MSWSGMTYLASNFWGCLLAATLLGFGLAWWLRGSGIGRKLSAFEAEWSRKLGLAHEESSRLSMQLKEATGHVGDWTSKFATLEAEHGTLQTSFADVSQKIPLLETAVAGWVAKSTLWDTDRATLQADLRACADGRGKLQLDLDAWPAKAKAWDTERANLNAEWEKKLATATTRTKELEGNVNEWKTKFTALDGNHGKLKTSFADVSGKVVPLEGLVAGWVAKSTLWDADRSKLQADLKFSTETRAKLESQISDLNALLSTTDAQLKKAIADDKAGDSAYEKTIADLRSRVSGLETEQQNWRTRYTSLEAEHSGCATKYASLQSRLVVAASAGSPTTTTTRKGGDIEDIQGIGPVYGGKLRKAGISWIRELLERGASAEGRAEIVEKTGLDADKVLTWVNHADLLRIEGVTPDWAELLEASGVDTVKELRNRVAENLHQKMEETNPNGPAGRYAPTVPELADVRKWVEKAKTMEPRVTH